MLPTDQGFQVSDGPYVGMGARQKCLQADIYKEAAFYCGLDFSPDSAVTLVSFFKFIPYPHSQRSFFGKNNLPLFVFFSHQEDIDFVPHFCCQMTFRINKFMDSNLTFRFITDINQNIFFINPNNFSFDYLSFLNTAQTFFV